MTASAGPALRKLHDEFSDDVAFLTLYVREAHPGERYPQPDDFDRKLSHARDYAGRDDLSWPVLVDDAEGTLHRKLDGKPNSAYLVDESGTVVFRTLWSNDEETLRDGLEAVARGRRPRNPDRAPRMWPMLGGVGEMYHVLGLAGEEARHDVRREMPPVYGMARVAEWFRPLESHRRGAAAAGAVAALLAGAASLGWLAVRRIRDG